VALRWLVDSARGSIAEALDGLTAFLRKYIAFPDPRLAVLAAAWALLTWCYRAFDTIPYLGIHAPVKRAGKTHCLDLLRLVSFNVTAIIVAPTETQLYREVEQTAGAQFFDEVDKFASDHDRWDAFIGSFNQGYQRGASANERSVTASELTLLCLHGNSSHRGVWRLVVRQLSEYRSVLVDFRGTVRASMSRRRRTTPSITPRTLRKSSRSSSRVLTRFSRTPRARLRRHDS
jgi:hypothetical protein